MEGIVSIVQTLGFPVACVIGLGVFIWKFVERIMNENKDREMKYQEIVSENNKYLAEYGKNLATISSTLERMESKMESCESKIIELGNKT